MPGVMVQDEDGNLAPIVNKKGHFGNRISPVSVPGFVHTSILLGASRAA